MPQNTVNLTITGLTFDNGGLLLQGQVFGVKILGNTFQNLTADNSKGNWTLGNAIFSPDGVHNATISGNAFKNILIKGVTRPDGTWDSIDKTNAALMFYGLDRTSIDHNTFDQVGQGLKICFTNKWPSHDVYIGYNTFLRVHRMGMEIQGAMGCGAAKPAIDGPDTYNMTIEYNSMTEWDDPVLVELSHQPGESGPMEDREPSSATTTSSAAKPRTGMSKARKASTGTALKLPARTCRYTAIP